MGRLEIVKAEELTGTLMSDLVNARLGDYLSSSELRAQMEPYFPRGNGGSLQLFRMTLEPDTIVNSHAHGEDEIIYVAAGQLVLGRRVLTAGSALQVEANTLYAFRAGPDGLTFLNFRAEVGRTYMTPAELRAGKLGLEGLD